MSRIKNSDFDTKVHEFKQELLLKELQKHEWNVLKVSKVTKLSRTTIYKLLEPVGGHNDRSR